MTDAEMLARLDALLELAPARQAGELARIESDDPAIGARLRRMLAAAQDTDHSRILAKPVLESLDAAHTLALTQLAPGELCAGYRLIREIGRGGMSVVWLAARADGVLKREVAIKLPLLVLGSTDDAQRFARERDALAALAHPNIARLYDAGVAANGQPFIVLEYVDGAPLSDWCESRRLDVRARLTLFLQVLAAVEDAHRHLLVHRDLKPANILVDTSGNVKLLDFGIARLLGESGAALTQEAGGALTPRYAAPEQLNGQTITTQTDVYALGVVLHELLTGKLPYGGQAGPNASLGEVAEAVLRTGPTRPSAAVTDRKLIAELRGDLDTITSKALAKAPSGRYASAERMANDIASYLAHRPIAARAPSLGYRLRRFVQRHRSATAVLAVAASITVAAGGVAWQQRQLSEAHATRTAAVRDFMFDLVSDAEPDETQGAGEITGKQMIEGAVRRAHREFGGDPRLQGELLAELGRMYERVGEPDGARQVLGEALELLVTHAPPDDPALNKTRAHLANLEYARGENATAQSLAELARTHCEGTNVECAKARSYGGRVLALVADAQGRGEDAVADMRRSVADMIVGFGAAHPETALARMDLATFARNAGHFTEASEALEAALADTQTLTLRERDRVRLLRTRAVLDFDLGRYQLARERLLDLAARAQDRGERALLRRLLANTELALGEPAAAAAAAEAGLADAEGDADEQAILHLAHARAAGLLGAADSALEEAKATVAALVASQPDSSPEVLRARRVAAEQRARMGDLAGAASELAAINSAHATAPEPWKPEWAQALELEGAIRSAMGEPARALAAHAAARELLAKQLPEGHPLLLRNSVYEAAARLRGNDNAGNRAAFSKRSRQYAGILSQFSFWRTAMAGYADPRNCDVRSSRCTLIL